MKTNQSVAIVAVALLAASVPAMAANVEAEIGALPGGESERYIVAFYELPEFKDGKYEGEPVVKVIDGLNMAVVETSDFPVFEARVHLDDNVRYVTWDNPNYATLDFVPNDYFYGHAAHWGSKRVGGEAAWDVTLGSTSVKVAMVDSGLNKGHEEYTGQARVLQGYDFRNGDNDPEDSNGCNYHGTHTTGTAGATINNGKGIAGMSQHSILPVKIFGSGFMGCGTTTTAVIEGLKYAGDQGAHVSSNSWGGGSSDAAINDAIRYAHDRGVTHVAAAGNDGPCSNCVGQPWKDNPDVTIVVSSLTDGDTFSDFSSEGPEVDVIAPGDYIASSTSGTADYHAMSGTSMAAPHVSGALALYVAKNGNVGYATLENALKSNAENLGMNAQRQGAGLLRADSMLGGGGGGGTNSPPTASFTFACSALTCDFDGSGSTDSDGSIASYSWDFGDGNTATGVTASHTYAADGTYTVTLTVTDDGGASDSDAQDVSVSSGGGGGITLSVTAYKVKGVQHADLSWSGATGTDVDVYHNGALLTTTANDGFHTHNRGVKGGGSADYKVCEAGSTTSCSNVATATW